MRSPFRRYGPGPFASMTTDFVPRIVFSEVGEAARRAGRRPVLTTGRSCEAERGDVQVHPFAVRHRLQRRALYVVEVAEDLHEVGLMLPNELEHRHETVEVARERGAVRLH